MSRASPPSRTPSLNEPGTSVEERERILGLLYGFRSTSIVLAAIASGVVDALRVAPKDESSLARETGAHAPSLARFLRALERIGIVRRTAGLIGLTAMGRCLADPADVIRARAKLVGDEYIVAWQHLAHTVMTGETAFDRAFGMSAWEYRARRPDLSAAFNRTMADHAARGPAAVCWAYDLTQARHDRRCRRRLAADLIAELLAALPARPRLSSSTSRTSWPAQPRCWRTAGVGGPRGRIVGGSFFDTVPAGGDTYILEYVLHDWSDEGDASLCCAIAFR